ncbi:uncharacterized protein LOC131842756 [Achroia grisella]|uniref:uncharacterized protein LOC131842756 n=1 Tax=Achroia grisella TaxID=688607 RepID=UPI0027D3247C|nr:uncharacterized protein LOC131842756 [Achroia grisella]
MAFSLRKMLSNITYFKKPGEDSSPEAEDGMVIHSRDTYISTQDTSSLTFDRPEPDSTSLHCSNSLKLPDSVKQFAAKKGSLSDTDILANIEVPTKKEKRKGKKLKLDIKKASQFMCEMSTHSSNDIENTPKHILLDCKSADLFSQRIKGFDFNKSFEIFDGMSDESSYEDFEIDSVSVRSDTDISLVSENEKEPVQMCRKVDPDTNDNQLVPSATPESFADVELDKNEEERISLLLNYQMKLERMECFLKKLLSEFQFHIEVSKVFNCRSVVTTLPGTDVSKIPKTLGEVTYIDNLSRGASPTGSWNIIMEKEDCITKFKVKKQLLSMKHNIDTFINIYLQNRETEKKLLTDESRSLTYDIDKSKRSQKRLHISSKKKHKRFDYPDIREAMLNLFSEDKDDSSVSGNNVTQLLSDYDESDMSKCVCRCRFHRSPSTESDSGVTTKNDRSLSSQSITSSIGNFSLDSSTLTAYSESLDQIVSYNSFQDTSLYSTLLQKAAIERITFYVQVHSIQLKCEQAEEDFETKNVITFHCPACKTVEGDENGLLKHILSQTHCEKIHFLYKTAYIKKCMSGGKEIQPSTVLNPMVMYRDENKIVCFGDAMFACSLCFENLIIGESVLMAHCADPEHLERKEKLSDLLE